MDKVQMSHGAGGKAMQDFLKEHVLKFLEGSGQKLGVEALDDSAVVKNIVFTTDSHTPKPLFFPGGDVGSLSVCGTVNDLAVMGAEPIGLGLGMVLEEGFSLSDFERIMKSIKTSSGKANVPIVTGDTKVVERGAVEGIIINTSGIGMRHHLMEGNLETARYVRKLKHDWLTDTNAAAGDVIIVTGTVGDHGLALMSHREGYGFESTLESDVAPLNHLMTKALGARGVVSAKDCTRGGLANALNEWADKSDVGIVVQEDAIPVRKEVRAAADMLGIDPFEVGNEGKAILAVVPGNAEKVLEAVRSVPEGTNAAIIGKVDDGIKKGMVVLETSVGGRRVMESPIGDPVPRIC